MRRTRQARPTVSAFLVTARSRRWVILGIVALLAAGVCVLMGRWQWERTLELAAADRAASLVPLAVEQVTSPDGALPNDQVGRRVILVGRYLSEDQQLVRPRLLGTQIGSWVLAPVQLSDGSIQAVLRGWVPAAATRDSLAMITPRGPVRVTGALQPYETFYADARPAAGSLVAINAELVAARWPKPLRPGVVVLQSQEPAPPRWPAAVPVAPGVQVSLPLQNAFYALQWVVFAGFALALWCAWVWRDAAEQSTTQATSVPS